MKTDYSNARPPQWAETLLRLLLTPKNRESVSGDLLRYRIHLEQRHYAPATINLRLAAVRRIAYEAADAGLLSPELAAGIRRVKGLRRIGVRPRVTSRQWRALQVANALIL